jgi:molybdenum cofactor cytidylyltransferase
MQAKEVAILIMAGGYSRRFGMEDKLTTDFNGLNLGLHTPVRLASLGWGQKLAVARPPLKAALEDLGYKVWEPPLGNGLGDNLAHGAKSLGDVAAVLVVLADMPFVTKAHVEAMLDAARSSESVVCTRSKDVLSPPILMGRDHFPGLLALSGDQGGKALIVTSGADLIEMTVDNKLAADIDTEEDFRTWQRPPEGQ